MMTGHLFGQSIQNNGKSCRILPVFSGDPAGRHADSAAHVVSAAGTAIRLLPNRRAQVPQTPFGVNMQSDLSATWHSNRPSIRLSLKVSDSSSYLVDETLRISESGEGQAAVTKPASRSHIPERYRERGRE